jgi:hypothetical protein
MLSVPLLCAFVHIVVLKCTVVVYLFVLNPLLFIVAVNPYPERLTLNYAM